MQTDRFIAEKIRDDIQYNMNKNYQENSAESIIEQINKENRRIKINLN